MEYICIKMNDRYLFKAKDYNSIWRAGLLIALQEGRCAIEEKDGSKWACDSETLCQCTLSTPIERRLIYHTAKVVLQELILTYKEAQ